jgi:hypothetical protein
LPAVVFERHPGCRDCTGHDGTPRKILVVDWLDVRGGAVVILLVLRQLNGFYGSDPKDVWSWFSQFVLPALTLLVGA